MESSSFACAQSYAMQVESRSVSRILFSCRKAGAAIIHLAHLLPNGSSDLPGGRKLCLAALLSGGQPCLTPPYLVLHYEEFTWPHALPHAPVRSYIKPPKGPHRFTHHPLVAYTLQCSPPRWLVSSLLHLSSPIPCAANASARLPSWTDAPPLAGSLPYSVRTFLSLARRRSSDRPTCSLARQAEYSKSLFNTYSTKASRR